jgi:hypothetical protein
LRKKNAELVSASLRLNEVLKQVRDDEEIFAYFVSIIPFDRAFKRFYNSGVLELPLYDLFFAGDRILSAAGSSAGWFAEIKDFSD